MTLNFPTNPALNATYEYQGIVYTWDGEKWDASTTVTVEDGTVTPDKLSTGGPGWDTNGNVTTAGKLEVDVNAGYTTGGELTAGTQSAFTAFSSSSLNTDTAKFTVYEGDTDTLKAAIRAGGSATFSGSVSVGGTDAAHTMDAYEEGVFTPRYTSGISGAGVYNLQIGNYTRVGNICHFQLAIRTTNAGDGGLLTIGDLPFTASTQPTSTLGGCYWVYTNDLFGTSDGTPFWQVGANSNTMGLYAITGDQWSGSSGGGIGNKAVWLAGSYRID